MSASSRSTNVRVPIGVFFFFFIVSLRVLSTSEREVPKALMDVSEWAGIAQLLAVLRQAVACWLLNVPATGECISGTVLLRQVYVLPH